MLRHLDMVDMVDMVAVAAATAGLSCAPSTPAKHSEPPPSAVKPAAPKTSEPVPPEDLLPVAIAPYEGGSSCNLVLRGDHLYWLTQGFAPRPKSEKIPAPRPKGDHAARGAALDCGATRGQVSRISTKPGSKAQVVAQTGEWPWSLGASDDDLYWIGYCTGGLWTVPTVGGTPRRLGRRDLSIIDHVATADGVLVADRFGSARGVFLVDPSTGATRPVVAEGGAPWLLGRRAEWVYWGEREGEQTTVHAADGKGLQLAAGEFRGMPMSTVMHNDEMFVLTTKAVVQVDADAVDELASVVTYHDRGNLAVDDAHLYWANGKPGTVSRMRRDGSDRVDAYLGGEPCGAAVDDKYLYWLDRGRNSVMKVHRALFDDPPPVPPPEPEPEPVSRIDEGDLPPPGLSLTVEGLPVKVRGGWAVDVKLHAHVQGEETFRIATGNPIVLGGTVSHPDDTASGFRYSCRSPGPSSPALTPGTRHTFTLPHDREAPLTLKTGDRLELDVGLCWVLTDDGRLHRVNAATVVVDVPRRGRPKVEIIPNTGNAEAGAPSPD